MLYGAHRGALVVVACAFAFSADAHAALQTIDEEQSVSPQSGPPAEGEPETAGAPDASTGSLRQADGRRRVLVLDLKAQGVDADTTRTLSDIVASAFARDRALAVTSGADVRAILDVEAAKETAGCDPALEACMAELAGALGADLVVSGSVGRLGSLLVVSISLYDAGEQSSIAKEKVEAELVQQLSPKIDAAVARMLGAAPPPVVSPLVVAGGATAAMGLLVGVGAGIGSAWSYGVQSSSTTSGDEKEGAEAAWPFFVGGALLGGGAALVGGGLVAAAWLVE